MEVAGGQAVEADSYLGLGNEPGDEGILVGLAGAEPLDDKLPISRIADDDPPAFGGRTEHSRSTDVGLLND